MDGKRFRHREIVMEGVFADPDGFRQLFGRRLPPGFVRKHVTVTIRVVD